MKGLASYLSFYYSLTLLYCLYDVLTNIYVYLFNVMSLMLSNEVGYNYDAVAKGSRLIRQKVDPFGLNQEQQVK